MKLSYINHLVIDVLNSLRLISTKVVFFQLYNLDNQRESILKLETKTIDVFLTI